MSYLNLYYALPQEADHHYVYHLRLIGVESSHPKVLKTHNPRMYTNIGLSEKKPFNEIFKSLKLI